MIVSDTSASQLPQTQQQEQQEQKQDQEQKESQEQEQKQEQSHQSEQHSKQKQNLNSMKSEQIIEAYFNRFTPYNHPGQMDLTRFIKFSYDSTLINRRFTVVDAELTFLRAKKKASISNKEKYKSGVSYDKRINFEIFYDILLRCIAEKMNESIDYVLHKVINAAKR